MSKEIELLKSADPKNVVVNRRVLRQLLDLVSTLGIRCQAIGDVLGPMDKAAIEHIEEVTGYAQAREDLNFLHAYLYHSGEKRDEIPVAAHDHLMTLCDGYGELTESELREKELLWDWSHVRDSSPEALRRARECLESAGASETYRDMHGEF